MDILEKLNVLAGSAKYDVSCASSGSQRPGGFPGARFGNTVAPGICHSFADDGRCISLLKVLFSNACVNDCAYCVNRRSGDAPRASFTVEELVRLTESFYRRNYIEGLFLSSGVIGSPDHTMELLVRTAKSLRIGAGFNGYIHLKVIPGASAELIREAGFWADRISANIELPSEESLRKLAPEKTGHAILSAMSRIKSDIDTNRSESRLGRLVSVPASRGCALYGMAPSMRRLSDLHFPLSAVGSPLPVPWEGNPTLQSSAFAPAGQSTQLIVGASPETDRAILGLSERLYDRYRLRRVYYSAFVPVSADPRLPALQAPPLKREHRLYQADWLLRFYGFLAEEILTEEIPFLDLDLDPKCAWALRHFGEFPVEVGTAEYKALLRIPGLGQKSAEKIIRARRYGSLSFETLKKIGVVMKRARYFITCGGKAMEYRDLPESTVRLRLIGDEAQADGGQLPLFESNDQISI
jgi:putative DNA modification/repair radical SAM protein